MEHNGASHHRDFATRDTAVQQDLQRRLVAVMFTDMVGYTALFQADELVAVDKRDRYVRAVEHHHQSFGGTIVKRLGDGSMSMFPSALAAVQAAPVWLDRDATVRKACELIREAGAAGKTRSGYACAGLPGGEAEEGRVTLLLELRG